MSKIKSLLIVTGSGGSAECGKYKYCFHPGCNQELGIRKWVHWGGGLEAGTGLSALDFVVSNIYNFSNNFGYEGLGFVLSE